MILEAALPEIPGVEILAPISAGGMGEVLLAQKRGVHGFEKLVAVKTMRREFSGLDSARAMFLDEARVLARITHPAIAQVIDFGEIGDELYLVLEYVPGVSFAKAGLRDPGIAARAMAEVCRGLHAAHELADVAGRPLGIVHRDVSPDNLVIGFDGRVKVLDFGIALIRDRAAPVTQIGQIRGKPAYLAPEQMRGERIDRRADVYGACAVLWELVAGRPRIAADRNIEVMIRAALSARASEPPEGCPGAIAEIVRRGLALDPARRFETARMLADALERAAGELAAEPLEVFAERSLAGAKRAHEEMLAEARSGRAKVGRASFAPVGGRVTEADVGEVPAAPAVSERVTEADVGVAVAQETPARAGSSRRALVALILIAAAVVGIAYFGTRAPAPRNIVVPVRAPDPVAEPVAAPERIPEPAPVPKAEPLKRKAPVAQPARPVAPVLVPVPAAVVDSRPARLTIGANPYALVYVDEEKLGPTPIVEHSLAPGAHRIRCVEPDTDVVRFDQTVQLSPGERKTLTIR